MLGPRGVISIRGDVKGAFDCERESCEMADRLMASVELQDLKQALAESPHPPLGPNHAQGQDFPKTSIEPEDSLSKIASLPMEEPSKVAHVDNNLDSK
jgi:hypothetical protein